MKLPPSTGRDERPAAPRLTSLPPMIIATLGSSGVNQTRHCSDRLIETFGAVPEHILFRAIDSTPQSRHDDLSVLPVDNFFNLAAEPQMQDRFRRAMEDELVAQWMPEVVTRLPLGDGMGGLEAATRYAFELVLSKLAAWMERLVDPFSPAKLPALAAQASRNPLLREANAAVNPAGPVRVIYVVSATGGTSGAMFYDLFFFRELLQKKGIEANFTLLMTPPAVIANTNMEAVRTRRKFYARLQEMVDLVNGKPFHWPAALERAQYGFPFEAAYILAEPRLGGLSAHNRKVGELLAQLATPLGKCLADRSVDMLGNFQERGPRGQKKFLSLLNITEVHACAYDDPASFVQAKIGVALEKSDAPATPEITARELLAELGVRPELATAAGVTANRPTEPEDDSNPQAFLRYTQGSLAAEVKQSVREQLTLSAQLLANAAPRLTTEVQKQTREAGPAAGLQFARALGKLLTELRQGIAASQARHAAAASAAAAPDLKTQLHHLWVQQVKIGRAEYLAELAPRVQTLIDCVKKPQPTLEAAADAIKTLAVESEQKQLAFDLTKVRDHAFMDRPALETLAAGVAKECQRQVWAAVAESLKAGHFDREKYTVAVREFVARSAKPMARFTDIDEAMRASGERAERVIEHAARAAEPDVRIDATWDRNRHSTRFLLGSAPEQHSVMTSLAGTERRIFGSTQLGRPNSVTIITTDFAVEPAALIATSEALAAFVDSTSDFPPYADKRYEPLADVMVPPEAEWYVLLTIPLNLVKHTGVVSFDVNRGWLYDGHEIGATRKAASALLRQREHRAKFLPTFDALSAQMKALLLSTGNGSEVAALLATLDDKVTREMEHAKPGERLILMLERSAIRALESQQRERFLTLELHKEIYGSNGHSRISPLLTELGIRPSGETS